MPRVKGSTKRKPAVKDDSFLDRPKNAASETLESVPLSPDSDLELIGEFITESREFIDNAERALLLLERKPDDQEAINTVFRAFHTIKGTAGYLNLTWI